MKRVLLIITFGLLSTTGHCSESDAAPADQGAAALATLQQAGHRTNPFLEENHQRRERLQRVRSSSAPATLSHTPSTAAPGALKKIKTRHDLTTLADDETDEELQDVFSPKKNTPTLEITPCLGELLTAGKTVANYNAGRRIIPAAALPLIAWIGSKTHWAQACFPALFPRSGTSTVIACSLAALATGAAAWAFKDSIAAGIHTKEAFKQMELSQRELAAMANQIEELRKNQLQSESQQQAMEKLLQETLTNAANARQGLEGLQRIVQALVAQIQGDLGNAVHIREVVELKKRVTALEAVLAQISLNQMSQADAQVPNLDDMAQQAKELAKAAQQFARTDDQQANEAFATAAVTEAKKKKKRFGLW